MYKRSVGSAQKLSSTFCFPPLFGIRYMFWQPFVGWLFLRSSWILTCSKANFNHSLWRALFSFQFGTSHSFSYFFSADVFTPAKAFCNRGRYTKLLDIGLKSLGCQCIRINRVKKYILMRLTASADTVSFESIFFVEFIGEVGRKNEDCRNTEMDISLFVMYNTRYHTHVIQSKEG